MSTPTPKYTIVVVTGNAQHVDADTFKTDDGMITFYKGGNQGNDKFVQVFAKGAWITVFNTPPGQSLIRPGAGPRDAVAQAMRAAAQGQA